MRDKPVIEPVVNGPLLVRDLRNFRNSRDEAIETNLSAMGHTGKQTSKMIRIR